MDKKIKLQYFLVRKFCSSINEIINTIEPSKKIHKEAINALTIVKIKILKKKLILEKFFFHFCLFTCNCGHRYSCSDKYNDDQSLLYIYYTYGNVWLWLI